MDVHFFPIYRKDFPSVRKYRRALSGFAYVISFPEFSLVFYDESGFTHAQNAIRFLDSLDPVFREVENE